MGPKKMPGPMMLGSDFFLALDQMSPDSLKANGIFEPQSGKGERAKIGRENL